MSYIYDPRTGLSEWMSEMWFRTQPHDSSHGVYGGPYGTNEEHEALRQQNAEQRDYSGFMYGPHLPAGTCSHHVSGFETSNSFPHFPARASSPQGSPQLWDSQRDLTTQERLGEYSVAAANRRHSRRDSYARNPDQEDLRSREDRLARRYAELGPAAYMKPIIARDGLPVPRLRPIFPTGPSLADEALFAGHDGTSRPVVYMEKTTSPDGLHPLSWHPRPGGPEPSLEEVNYYLDTSSRQLTHALDEYYRRDLKEDPGHRFDDVDDTVIAAYTNACEHAHYLGQHVQRIHGRDQPFSFFDSWVVPIPFLKLRHSALEVMLPLDQEAITMLNNDILRVLYVLLSNDSRDIPGAVTIVGMEDSRRRVLSELMRRGFTGEMPHAVRIRGLNDRSVPRRLGDPDWLHGPVSASSMPVDQTSRKVKTFAIRTPKGSGNNKARQDERRGSSSMTDSFSGEVSEKKKGKAPVTRVYEIDSSDHSSAASSPNNVHSELEVSSPEDSTSPTRGKTPAVEATSRGKLRDSSEKGKHKAETTPPRRKRGVPDQKSDHSR